MQRIAIFRMLISNVLVLVLYLVYSVCCELCRDDCHIGRVQKMKSADCFRRDMRQVPHCLPGNIEILDLSYNRIREITQEDFSNYPYLQILYLSDNIITDIDNDALDYQTSLHTLDVSSNVFYNIPKALFHLPLLRKLYLGNIRNQKMVEDIEAAVPITSPLMYLDLSQNRLPRLPILGLLPALQSYNVSGNENVKLNTSMFAGLCNLQVLTNDQFSAVFENTCVCQILERWLTTRDVIFKSFNCEQIECSNELPQEDLDVFNRCRKLHETQQQELYQKKLLTNVGITMGAILGLLLIILYLIYRRNKLKQMKKMEMQAQNNQKKEVIDDQVLL